MSRRNDGQRVGTISAWVQIGAAVGAVVGAIVGGLWSNYKQHHWNWVWCGGGLTAGGVILGFVALVAAAMATRGSSPVDAGSGESGDVASLLAATKTMLAAYGTGSVGAIPAPNHSIKLKRASTADIIAQAQHHSLLVVGDPGIGKSIALADLVHHELDAGRLVLFLSVGTLESTSSGSLRSELGLDTPLLDVLASWSPGTRKLLVIDSLDAARTDAQADMWRAVIGQVITSLPDWRVVASIRRWDAQHSHHLKSQFESNVIDLGELTDEELSEIAGEWQTLSEIVLTAPTALRGLLRNPFNLRLVAEMLLAGTAVAELEQITNRLALLDRYWDSRVADGQNGIARQVLLGRVCEYVIGHRVLAARLSDVLLQDASSAEYVRELLSRAVLADTGPPSSGGAPLAVRFSHQVLLDFAIAKTIFGAAQGDLLNRLHEDPNLVLFARPSIDMHLERCWDANDGTFWTLARAVAADAGVPRMATAAVADVVARRARSLDDLAPLISTVLDGSGGESADRLLRYVALAAVIRKEHSPELPAGVWPAVVAELSLQPERAELPLRILLDMMIGLGTTVLSLGSADLRMCGEAARRQLQFLWGHPPSPVSRMAIHAVIMTSDSDPVATEALLDLALEPDQLAARGFNDLPWLCDHVPRLARTMPSYTKRLYETTMNYEEESNDPTPLLGSRILPLSSNRRQDVDTAKYHLVEDFGSFLNVAPDSALDALILVVEPHIERGDERVVALSGGDVRIVDDRSATWDHFDFSNGHEFSDLLDGFEKHLASLPTIDDAAAWIERLSRTGLPAVLWRRVLVAARQNEHLLSMFVPLGDVMWAAHDSNLAEPFAGLIDGWFAQRSPDERLRIQTAIMAMHPGANDGSSAWYSADRRHRLMLHALPAGELLSPDLEAARAASVPPRTGGSFMSYASDEEFLPQGVTLDTDGERYVWASLKQINEFTTAHLNETPTAAQIADSVVAVQKLVDHLGNEPVSGPLRDQVDTAVARSAEIWTRRGDHPHDPALALAKSILLEASRHQRPEPSELDEDRPIDLIPQGPRTEATKGLIQLARLPGLLDADVRQALQRLATDDVTWIRYVVVSRSFYLADVDTDLMWQLLRNSAANDTSDTVLRGVVEAAWKLREVAPDEVVGLLDDVATRATATGRRSALAQCIQAAGMMWVLMGNEVAHTLLIRLSDIRERGADGLAGLLHVLKEADAFKSDSVRVRERTIGFCQWLVDQALATVGDFASWNDDAGETELKARTEAVKVLESVGAQLYFSSGAFDPNRNGVGKPTAPEIRLAEEATGLIAKLSIVPLPSLSHYLAQTYEYFLDDRPGPTLLGMRDLLTAGGRVGGYQTEHMALGLAIRVAERVLADHRGVLDSQDFLTALREILDVFVDAGWPDAHRLAFGLEYIFR